MARRHTWGGPGARALAVGALVLAVAACTPEEPRTAEPTRTAAPEDAPQPTASAGPALDDAALAQVFTAIQFPPGQYEATSDLLASVYPGLEVADDACLAPFGLGWEQQAGSDGTAAEFGTSTDRSMTAVVVSSADTTTAGDLLADAQDALAGCAGPSGAFTLAGAPVDVRLERTDPQLDGVDDAVGWTAQGDVGGMPFTLVGTTAVVGGTAIALVGWDPATSASYVPAATQMFVDQVAAAG